MLIKIYFLECVFPGYDGYVKRIRGSLPMKTDLTRVNKNGMELPGFKSALMRMVILLLLTFSPPHKAAELSLVVESAQGGAIGFDEKVNPCRSPCRIDLPKNLTLSLFAVAHKGYRFRRWFGACAGASGPLCTLSAPAKGQVAASFVQAKIPDKPAKVLLLLHGENTQPSIWNKFAETYFEHQCPEIYGGVILDESYSGAYNNVYCYRVAFGYYRTGIAKAAAVESHPQHYSEQTHLRRQRNEIQAAVLGIRGRHVHTSIMIIAEASMAKSAALFLKTPLSREAGVLGALSLASASAAMMNSEISAGDKDLPMTYLALSPRQPVKINQALIQTTGTWWLSK